MSVMKQVVMNLSTRKYGEKKTQSRDLARPKSPKSLSIHLPAHDFETYDEPNVVKPGSISLVSRIIDLYPAFVLFEHSNCIDCRCGSRGGGASGVHPPKTLKLEKI